MNRKMFFIIISLLLMMIIIGAGYFFFFRKSPLSKSQIKVGSHAFEIEIANTAASRAQGLSGREKLKDNEGMLFVFPSVGSHSFWMMGMNFHLDFVWILDDEVAGITENVQPEKKLFPTILYPLIPVNKVLEINAGEAAKRGIKAGDKVYPVE